MSKKRTYHLVKALFVALHCIFLALPLAVSAAQVTLQWDANDPQPEGYRLYQREVGQPYDYSSPAWSGTATSATLSDLVEGATYYYVVRAYDGNNESGDSNEVQYVPAVAVLDSDGDGMPDVWETLYGLDPLTDDADQDLDNDGVTNVDEFLADSDPSQAPNNFVPNKPQHLEPYHQAIVGLTPALVTHAYADPDNDRHTRTCYQISTEEDFSILIYEKVSSVHLTRIDVPDLILDPETTYYWRTRFYDSRDGMSEWSDYTVFTTIDHVAAGDANGNGILDEQEIMSEIDLDGDGNNDAFQGEMLAVRSADPFNPYISIKRIDGGVQLVGIQAMNVEGGLALVGSQPENLTGVISFKLHLPDGITETSVVVYFSQPAPANARWYKYDPDSGWLAYPEALFSDDRRSVVLTLEDGGFGDMDGVQNGVIVDPAGLGYSNSQSSDSSSGYSPSDAGSSGCFISAATFPGMKSVAGLRVAALLIVGSLGAFGRFLTRRRSHGLEE